jgi:hypothetical protein
MRRLALTAAIIAAGLALAGCAATQDEPEATQPAVSSTQEKPAPSASGDPEPLVAETPTDFAASESEYLENVRELLPAKTQVPDATDEQLLAVGREACTRMAAGETSDTIVLIDGETPNPDSGLYLDTIAILTAAALHLCQ